MFDKKAVSRGMSQLSDQGLEFCQIRARLLLADEKFCAIEIKPDGTKVNHGVLLDKMAELLGIITPTKYTVQYDGALSKPWSFTLEDDNGNIEPSLKRYKTKGAAAGVAARRVMETRYDDYN